MTSAQQALARRIIATTLHALPGLRRALKQWGEWTLGDYTRALHAPATPRACDPHADLVNAVAAHTAPLLGESIARAAHDALEHAPATLTANHHGVDTLHQSVHSTIAYALPALLDSPSPLPAIVVLACAGTPLNNVTYPRGLVLANTAPLPTAQDAAEVRIPIHPNSRRNVLAWAAPPWTRSMLEASRSRLDEASRGPTPQLRPAQADAASRFILEALAHPTVLAASTFADQAVLANAALWRRLFAREVAVPPLVYLDMERVAATLLARDLGRPSLLSALFFEPDLRAALLEALDGVPGCWRAETLEALARAPALHHESMRGAGSVFFWGIDDHGRRFPLRLDKGAPTLRGSTLAGEPFAVALAPAPLLEALDRRRLLPSLFTCYTAVALARGAHCYGGVYQAAYLESMRRGVIQALSHTGETAMAELLRPLRCDRFLAGVMTTFLALQSSPNECAYVPACATDIAAAGGLTRDHLERMARLTLREANHVGSLQTYAELTPRGERPQGWRDAVTAWALAVCGERLALASIR